MPPGIPYIQIVPTSVITVMQQPIERESNFETSMWESQQPLAANQANPHSNIVIDESYQALKVEMF